MDDPERAYRHTREDVSGVAGAQVLGLLASALSGLLFGIAYRGARTEDDFPIVVPLDGIAMFIIGGFALSCAMSLPGRYRHVWGERRARRWIITGLLQALVTAAGLGLACVLVLGGVVDLWTDGQTLLTWAAYGLIAGSLVQTLTVVLAFVFLMLSRELPEIVD